MNFTFNYVYSFYNWYAADMPVYLHDIPVFLSVLYILWCVCCGVCFVVRGCAIWKYCCEIIFTLVAEFSVYWLNTVFYYVYSRGDIWFVFVVVLFVSVCVVSSDVLLSQHNWRWPEETEIYCMVNIVAYLLKVRTVEPEKQPLLGNGRTQQ
jgi:predicted membrane metal-binding protein